jgi:hypothetical protein
MANCAHLTQNRLLHIGHVDELLELNHLYKQLAWNRFLQVRHGLDGRVRSFIEIMLFKGGWQPTSAWLPFCGHPRSTVQQTTHE